jgi:hypothetical protein
MPDLEITYHFSQRYQCKKEGRCQEIVDLIFIYGMQQDSGCPMIRDISFNMQVLLIMARMLWSMHRQIPTEKIMDRLGSL